MDKTVNTPADDQPTLFFPRSAASAVFYRTIAAKSISSARSFSLKMRQR